MPENKKYYVTMTDMFMSGWGMAKNKINKLVFICDSYSEACIVESNAKCRPEMKYVNICSKKPYYNSNRYFAQYNDKEEYSSWYIKDYFRNQK